jgi:hypothetical protein
MTPRCKPVKPSSAAPVSLWSRFRHRLFALIGTATVDANIGSWMCDPASAWLMTSLDASPAMEYHLLD